MLGPTVGEFPDPRPRWSFDRHNQHRSCFLSRDGEALINACAAAAPRPFESLDPAAAARPAAGWGNRPRTEGRARRDGVDAAPDRISSGSCPLPQGRSRWIDSTTSEYRTLMNAEGALRAETLTDAGPAEATSEPITTRGDHPCFGN